MIFVQIVMYKTKHPLMLTHNSSPINQKW